MKREHRVILDMAISLVLAVLIWVYVVGQREGEWLYAVPVNVFTSTSSLSSVVSPSRVDVTVRGPRRLLNQLRPEDLACRIQVAAEEPGVRFRPILPYHINGLPHGLEITRVEPSEVRIELVENIEVELPVQVMWQDPGFEEGLDNIDVSPPVVRLYGPVFNVEQKESVPTVPIIPESAAPGEETTVRVRLAVPAGASAAPDIVSVTYSLREAVDE